MGNLFSQNFKSTPLRSINDVAEELQLEPYILRFWENKFPAIKPVKGKGNRRLYNSEDIKTIKKIKDLLYNQGYTIEGANKYLNNKFQSNEISMDSNAIESIINELKGLKSELKSLSEAA